MKFLAALLIIGLYVRTTHGNCVVEGVTNDQPVTTPVLDTARDVFLTFNTENVRSVQIESTETNGFPYMDVKYEEDTKQLTFFPKSAFSNFEKDLPSSLSATRLTLAIRLQCEDETSRVISFHVPITDTNNHDPEFSNPSYEYKLPMPFPTSVDVTQYGASIVVTDIDISNIRVEFSISPDDFFIEYDGPIANSMNKQHQALLTAKRPLRFDGPQQYVLTVKDTGSPQLTSTASITIDIDEDASIPQSPAFAEAFIIGEYITGEVDAFYAEVKLDSGVNAHVTLSGAYSDNFRTTNTDGTVGIILERDLPDDITDSFIVLTLTATVDNSENDAKLAVIIKIENDVGTTTDCPGSSTPGDCECPTTPPLPSAIVKFKEQLYSIIMNPGGSIPQNPLNPFYVEATSSIVEEITYSTLEPMPNNLYLSKDGKLETVGNLPTGTYVYTLVATGTQSKAEGYSELRIVVGSISCPGEMIAAYSLLVKHVLEEQDDVVELIPHINEAKEYHYEIEGIVPSPLTNVIYIDDEGNVVASKLDRESDEFENRNPQYTVTIRVKTDISSSAFSPLPEMLRNSKTNSRAVEDQCLMLDDIGNEGDKIVLAIIVNDYNDHPPEFEKDQLLIGYPEEDILSLVSPPYVMQTKATDQDTGINAEIAYSIDDSDVITIDSTTGIVYPLNIYDVKDQFTFDVTAIDQNGDGLSSKPLLVTVKFLREEHISVISIKNQYFTSVDKILSKLSSEAGPNIDIKHLTASVLPTDDLSRTARDVGNNYLVIIAYAFKDTNLLTREELQNLLDDVDDMDISALPNTSGNESGNKNDDDSDTGLIAAVIVLAILLAVALVGFIALYFLKFRKTENYAKMEEDGFSKPSPEQTPPQFIKNKNLSVSKIDVDVQQRRPTGIVLDSQFTEDDSTPTSPEEAMNDQMRDRRKSVVFNSEIEEISIERDADNDGEQEADAEKKVETKESNAKNEDADDFETSKL